MDAEGKGHVVENSKVNNGLVADIDYLNAKQNTAQYFDYSEKIAEQMKAYPVNPEAAKIDIAAEDANGASGVVLTASRKSQGDYCLNALVAGHKINLNATGDNKVATAVSSNADSDIKVTDGNVSFTPAAINADAPADEVITVTMTDGTEYRVHTVNEMLPGMDITNNGVKASDAGVYTFALDHFFLRVNTEGELVYYRYIPQYEVKVDDRDELGVKAENMAENFAAQDAIDGSRYYTAFIELEPTYRNARGGYSSGYYLVMDENYTDIDEATLAANDDEKHYHGQGYLDQHEFVVLGKDHYINLSYTPVLADNLPETVKGLDGGNTAYVWVGIIQEVKDGKVIKIEGMDGHPSNDGRLCSKGLANREYIYREDRIKTPLKRVGKRGEGKFTRISWAEAVDTIASEWIRIRDTYGVGSRYVNYATGISALNRGNNMAKRLLNLDGGFLDYYNSYSTACIRQATDIMYGTNQTGHNPEDWLNSNLIILWGHNPEETKFDSVTMNVLLRAKKKGIPIIVIDPRRNDTAVRLDAEWIPIRPATDSALMDAMAWVIVEEGLQDQEFLNRCCIGFDKEHMPDGVDPSECYLSYLYGEKDGVEKTPEWAETITGVPADTIRSLARRYALAKPAALIQGYGPQRNANGEQSTRGGILLACMTGNVGISGGWASGTADWVEHKNPSWPSCQTVTTGRFRFTCGPMPCCTDIP